MFYIVVVFVDDGGIIIRNSGLSKVFVSCNYFDLLDVEKLSCYEILKGNSYFFNSICFVNVDDCVFIVSDKLVNNVIGYVSVARRKLVYGPIIDVHVGDCIEKFNNRYIVFGVFKDVYHVFNGRYFEIWNISEVFNVSKLTNPKCLVGIFDSGLDVALKGDFPFFKIFESFTNLSCYIPTRTPQKRHFVRNLKDFGLNLKEFRNGYDIFSHISGASVSLVRHNILKHVLDHLPRFMSFLFDELPSLKGSISVCDNIGNLFKD